MDNRDITILKPHGYGKMDSSKIFYTAVEDIPIIKKFFKKELIK